MFYPLCSRGGIEDSEAGEITDLRTDHQFLEERESDQSFMVRDFLNMNLSQISYQGHRFIAQTFKFDPIYR